MTRKVLNVLAMLQKGLQDQHRGETINSFTTLFDAHFALAQHAIGFNAGEALVPEMHRERKLLFQQLGEFARFFRRGALRSTKAKRQTHDDLANLIPCNYVSEKGEIGSLVFAQQGRKALRGDAKRIGDGETNAAGSIIDRKNTPVACRGSL